LDSFWKKTVWAEDAAGGFEEFGRIEVGTNEDGGAGDGVADGNPERFGADFGADPLEKHSVVGDFGGSDQGFGADHGVGKCGQPGEEVRGFQRLGEEDLAAREFVGEVVAGVQMGNSGARSLGSTPWGHGVTAAAREDRGEVFGEGRSVDFGGFGVDGVEVLADVELADGGEFLGVGEVVVGGGFELEGFEVSEGGAFPEKAGVENADLPSGLEEKTGFKDGEGFEQGQRVGGAVEFHEKKLVPGAGGGEEKVGQLVESFTADARAGQGGDRGGVAPEGFAVERGVFAVVQDDVSAEFAVCEGVQRVAQEGRFPGSEEAGEHDQRTDLDERFRFEKIHESC